MRVLVDAMGSDHGLAVPVGAAVELAANEGMQISLIGDQQAIRGLVPGRFLETGQIGIHDAPDRLDTDSDIVREIRRAEAASIPSGLRMIKHAAEPMAFVSSGNTGAVVAASTLLLGRLHGIDRPGIGIIFPTQTEEHTLMIDAGAVIDPRARVLLQYGIMGTAYMNAMFGYPRPRVGLLSNGEEASKGDRLAREAFILLSESPLLTFKGNIEGNELTSGLVDVIVTDGFTGNVTLKTAEGVAQFVQFTVKQELMSSWHTKLLAGLLRPAFRRAGRRLDYREQGGAPLLGVNGTVIIAHGRSDVSAFKNAVRTAHRCLERSMLQNITRMIAEEADSDHSQISDSDTGTN